jgi:TP901 family phage tail tape measure protein
MSIQVASLYVSVDGETSGADTALNRVDQRLNQVADTATRAGTTMTAGLTLPLGLLGKTAITAGMDYQTMMAIIQEQSGATIQQMRLLGDQAIALGGDLQLPGVDASDAVATMLELSKAGLSIDASMQAARGSLSLAIIESMGFARAAQITAGALNTFSLEGDKAVWVTDLLAAGSNASSASVLSLADGMNQAGFAFANANQTLPDLITALAILSNNGLSGSDAGTALKNAFMRLMSPTKEAQGVMRDLGISFFDVNGNMLPLVSIIGVLNTGLAGLTQQERLAALETIFLSDGMKAMLPLLGAGSIGFLDMQRTVTAEGAAAGLAAAKNSGLRGAIDGLKSTVDTFLLEQALPFLETLEGWTNRTSEAVNWIRTLDQRFINAGIAVAGFLAVAGPVLLFIGRLAAVLAFVSTPLGAIIGVATALVGVFAGDLGGATTNTIALFNGLMSALQQFGNLPDIRTMFAQLGEAMRLAGTGDLSGAFSQLLAGGDSAGAAVAGIWTQLQPALQTVGQQLWNEVQMWGFFLSQWIPARIPFVLQELEELGQVVYGWLLIKATDIGFGAALWGLQLLGWASRQIPTLLAELEGLAGHVQGWILLKGTELGFAIALWGVGFVAWIAPMAVGFLAELALWGLGVYSWILAQVPILQQQFTSWWDAFIVWIGPAFVDFLGQWATNLDLFLTWIGQAAGPLLLALGEWAIAFIQWVLPLIPPLLVALGGVALAIGAWILTTAFVLAKHVGMWALALYEWVQKTAIPGLAGALVYFVISLSEWIGTTQTWLKTEMTKMGVAMVKAMIAGIASWWPQFIVWLNNKIAELPLAVKIALGLASPAFANTMNAIEAEADATGAANSDPKQTGSNTSKAPVVIGAPTRGNTGNSGGAITHTHYHNHQYVVNGNMDIAEVVRDIMREFQYQGGAT